MMTPTLEQAQNNYAGLAKLPFYPGLCAYFSSGPIVAMAWEGKDVIKTGRAMVDEVRAVYAADRGRNCIDGSDSTEGAAEERVEQTHGGRWRPSALDDRGQRDQRKEPDNDLEHPESASPIRKSLEVVELWVRLFHMNFKVVTALLRLEG